MDKKSLNEEQKKEIKNEVKKKIHEDLVSMIEKSILEKDKDISPMELYEQTNEILVSLLQIIK